MEAKPKHFSTHLIRSDAKTEIFLPIDTYIQITLEEFYEALSVLTVRNRLPAAVKLSEVNWDQYTNPQKRIVVYHENTEFRTLQLVIGLQNVGNFYYIEERLCYDLPDQLPPVPSKRIVEEPINPEENKEIGKHIFEWFLWTFTAIGFYVYPIYWYRKYKEDVKNYPSKLEQWKLTKAFDQALTDWINEIIEADNKSRADDEIGRFFSALSSTVNQVIEKLFVERNAELRERKEKQLSQQELNEELERRRREGFI